MSLDIFASFLYNILMLMSIAVVYYVFKNDSFFHPKVRKVLMGFMVSFVMAFIMWNSYLLSDGIMFDSRAVLLSISGMFFGLIPTVMGMITAIIVRIFQGGVGAPTGIIWIVVSGTLGLLWRQYRLKRNTSNLYKINWIELYLFGLLIQIVMILLLFFLPSHLVMDTISSVAFPLLVIYPIGSFFISQFLLILRRQYFNDIKTIESERQYRRLFSKNKANLMLIDASTGLIKDANETSEETYGYSLSEFKNMHITKINTLSSEEFKVNFNLAISQQQSHFHMKHVKKSGEEFDVEIFVSVIILDNKEHLYITVIDTSDKVQSEKMFKDADDRLRATLLSVGEGVVVIDDYDRITLVNDKAMELLKRTGSLERKKVFNEFRIYSNQSNNDFESLYRKCISENTIFRSDNTYSLLTSKDEMIFIDFTISPINNEHGIKHGAILVFRDVSIEKGRQEEIRFMSRHDYLTGSYNRYNFERELERLNTKRQLPISLIIGDINGLKLVNDAFGHLEGDKLIKEVASIFKKSTRSEDIVARWGGDEFAILLPQTDEEGAISVVNRIKDLCEKSMYDVITPSVAIGISTKISADQDIREVLTQAEELMYNAKLTEGPIMREQLLSNLLKVLNRNVAHNESHTTNIIDLVDKYCDFYNLPEKDRVNCRLLAKYHDIGRIGIENSILNKVQALTENEWTKIKNHPEIGSRLVATIPELQHLSKGILQHHERFDGTGYPLGLKGEEIDEEARLLSILDSYEAMTNERIYKPVKTHDEAINEILKNTGTQFDPHYVQLFIEIFKK